MKNLNYRQLGNSDLKVSEIGFGCMSLSSSTEADGIRMIETSIERGVNFFDTADLYEFGLNEEIVGKALQGKRHEVIIATKVGNRWNEKKDGWYWDPSKQYIKSAVHDSLKRLRTDYIDLYQLHGGTIDDPIDEIVEAFEELKSEGLIREYGISSIRPNVIHRFIEKSNIVSIMMPYSILDRRAEEFFPLFEEKNISVIARGPLCKGLLTTNWKNKLTDDGFLVYTKDEIIQLNGKLASLTSGERDLTQIALLYALSPSAVATVIPGASRMSQLEDILSTIDAQKLTDVEVEKINNWTKKSIFTLHRE